MKVVEYGLQAPQVKMRLSSSGWGTFLGVVSGGSVRKTQRVTLTR